MNHLKTFESFSYEGEILDENWFTKDKEEKKEKISDLDSKINSIFVMSLKYPRFRNAVDKMDDTEKKDLLDKASKLKSGARKLTSKNGKLVPYVTKLGANKKRM